MTRLSEIARLATHQSQAVQSYQVKSKGVKKTVKRLEEPGFPARGAATQVMVCFRDSGDSVMYWV